MKAAHIGNRIGMVRLDRERARESVMDLLTLAQPNQHISELVVKFGVVRLDCDGRAQAVRGSTLVARLIGNPPKLKLSSGMPGIARQHLSDELLGLADLATPGTRGRLRQKRIDYERACVAGLPDWRLPGR
jgi:hypothetical protein